MYARVARWEGSTAEDQRSLAEFINNADGPPEGVPSSGVMVLSDEEGGGMLVIGLFGSEEDLRVGDEALRTMDLPVATSGEVKSVEFYEVTVNRSA